MLKCPKFDKGIPKQILMFDHFIIGELLESESRQNLFTTPLYIAHIKIDATSLISYLPICLDNSIVDRCAIHY